MKKEDRLLFLIKWIFYGIGGVCLASFMLVGFFREFIVDLVPSCYFSVDFRASIECGPSFFENVLASYLNFFSHSAVSIPFDPFSILLHAGYLSWFTVPLLIIATLFLFFLVEISPLIVVYALSKRLVWGRRYYSSRQQRIAFICFCLILLPTFCMGVLKLYLEPPRFINRTITIDLWHTDLKIEQRYLDKWSIMSPVRPAEKPEEHSNFLISLDTYPFARIEIPYREIVPSLVDDEKIFIYITPHYNVMTAYDLAEERKKNFDDESANFFSDYKPANKQNEFEVFEPFGTVEKGYKPAYYVHRGKGGKINNLFECTPDTHCSAKTFWDFEPCENEEACKSCLRVCTDKSLGTETLNIEYRFDKKYLDSYFVLHQEVLDFVAAHTVAK